MITQFFLLLFIIHVKSSYFYRNSSIQNLPHVTSLAICGRSNQYLIMGTLSDQQNVSLHIYTEDLSNSQYLYSKNKSITFPNKHEINVLFLSQDNQILLVGTHNDKIRFYIFQEGELEEKMGIDGWQGDQNDIYLSSDDNFLAIGNKNNTISIYQNKSQQTVQKPINLDDQKLNSPFPLGKPNAKQNKTQQLPLTGFNLPLNFKLIQTINSPRTTVSALLFSHNSSKLYVGYQNKSLIMYTLKDYKYYHQFQQDLNDDYVTSMKLSEFGEVLITGSKQGVVRVYSGSVKGDKLVLRQKMYEPKEEIMSVRITQDNLMVLVTTLKQVTFVYTRDGKGKDFYYDADKSETFRRQEDRGKKQVKEGDQNNKKENLSVSNNNQTVNSSLTNQTNVESPKTNQIVANQTTNQNTQSLFTNVPINNSTIAIDNASVSPTISQLNINQSSSLSSRQTIPRSQLNSTPRLLSQQPQIRNPGTAQLINSSETSSFNSSSLRLVPTYLSRDDSLFIQAEQNNNLIIYVACERTITNCQYCKDNISCLSCVPDFYLSYNRCRRCDDGCRRCKGETCFNCQNGYYLNVNLAKCIKCSKNLANCQSCANSNQCSKCSANYTLKDRKCILKPTDVKNATKTIETHTTNQVVQQNNKNIKGEEDERSYEESRLLTVFIIICIVFVILLVVVGFLVFYINKLAKGTGMQSETNQNIEEGIPRVVYTERRIINEPLQ